MRRRALLTLVSVVAAAAVLGAAGMLVVRGVANARRMREIRVRVDLPPEEDLARLVTARLERSPGDVDEESRVVVIESGDADVVIGPAHGVADGARNGSRDVVIAVDPYVIIVDKRAGEAPTAGTGATIPAFAEWLDALDRDLWTPFVVAGDDPVDFAAFTLYLAGEVLAEDDFELVLSALAGWVAAGSDSEDSQAADAPASRLTPVVDELQRWRNRGLVAVNWTDWDDTAARRALRTGSSAAAYRRRSDLGALTFSQAFYLDAQRPPVGAGRRSYRLFGNAVAVQPGPGPRADAADGVLRLLREGEFQTSIEEETQYSPVLIAGSPLNRSHRDIVRWYQGAEEMIVVDERVADHPVFRRLHTVLR